jgi:hypothetical protein
MSGLTGRQEFSASASNAAELGAAPTQVIGSLQDRILEVIRAHQPLRAKELVSHFADVDANALDCGVIALMRTHRVTLLGGHYDLAKTTHGVACNPTSIAPPTAAEEAAASLGPEKQVCEDCARSLSIGEFQFVRGEKRSLICRGCMGRRAQNGRLRNQSGAAPVDPSVAIVVEPQPADESPLAKLERKRDALVARREQLTMEYEAKLKDAIDRVAAINHLLAEVKRLSEEPV